MKQALFVVIGASALLMHGPAFAQGGPPGAGQPQTLETLDCTTTGEIARRSGTEWVCSSDLTTLENQNLDDRVTTLEDQDLDNRLTGLEGQDLGSRLGMLEIEAVQFLRTIVVSPIGPTVTDNGDELLAGVQEATNAVPPPSFDDPVLILIEPGVYDVGAATVSLPDHVGLRGAGEGLSRIVGGSDFAVVDVGSNTVISDLGVIHTGTFEAGIRVSAQDVVLRDLLLSRAPINAVNFGIKAVGGADVFVESVVVEGFLMGARFEDSDAFVTNMNSLATTNGILADDGAAVTVTDSRLQSMTTAVGSGLSANAPGTTVVVRNSQLGNASADRDGKLQIHDSLMRTLGTNSPSTPGNARVAGSQIAFPASVDLPATCVFSYDASFAPIGSSCQ